MSKPYVVIMAGGIGSRFWPASKESLPKQFLDILGTGSSLIQLTYQRFLGITDADRIIVVTSAAYQALVEEHLPDLPRENILCEPTRKNTAPAVALAAYYIGAKEDDAVMIVAPSDHVILKETVFLDTLRKGVAFAKVHDSLLTIGISPTRPDTGYGYIEYDTGGVEGDIHSVTSFREKPTLAVAQQYVDSGNYVWNAGIFIWSISSIKRALSSYSQVVSEVFESFEQEFHGDLKPSTLEKVYSKVPSISIDYAVMEHATNIKTLPADIGWSDLGTWASVYAFLPKDENQNVMLGSKPLLKSATNNLVNIIPQKTAIIRGLENYIVVDSGDALLIYPMNEEQRLKSDLQQLPRIDS